MSERKYKLSKNLDGEKFNLIKKHKLFAFFIAALLLTIFIVIAQKSRSKKLSSDHYASDGPVKIYLSPAAHKIDNPCAYSEDCGENTHANLYMDEVERLLIINGFNVKRNSKNNVGENLMKAPEEANKWGADLYYVAHTNASDNHDTFYSLLMTDSKNANTWAKILKKHRAEIYPHDILITHNDSLAESNKSDAPTLYDEIVFHDYLSDITWFHEKMDVVAANTVEGICEAFNVNFSATATTPQISSLYER